MRKKNKSLAVYKYIMYRIKKLICDGRGKIKYMVNFDVVIEEIFGVKNFSKNINELYDTRDIIDLVDTLGLETLYELLNNPQLFSMLDELTRIDARLKYIKKKLKKKDKRDKYLIKEYNYLTKLFKDGVKYIRKRFGIRNAAKAYKRKYRALNDILHGDNYDDDEDGFSSILLRDDDYFFDYDDDDDDDDYGEYGRKYVDDYDYDQGSIDDDFYEMLHGRDPRRRDSKVLKRRKRSSYEEMAEDWNDEDEEDYNNFMKKDDTEKRVDHLTDVVMELSEGVQALLSQQEYERRKRPIAYDEAMQRYEAELKERERLLDKATSSNWENEDDDEPVATDMSDQTLKLVQQIAAQVEAIGNNTVRHEEVIQVMARQQMEINDFLDRLMEDDDDDIDDESSNIPIPKAAPTPAPVEDDIVFNEPQIVEEVEPSEEDIDKMTTEEMVDAINSSIPETKDPTGQGRKPVKMVQPNRNKK